MPDDPESAKWLNRRAHDRAKIQLRVDYKRMNTFFADYAKNISKGGTFIRTTKPLDIGTEFIFVLAIPGQTENLQLTGEVMWVVTEEQAAAETKADVICFAGVHFMAETAKILNPDRVVVVPDLDAGCSLADGCPADKFAAWKAQHPGAVVVSYINCSADVKALSDYIVT